MATFAPDRFDLHNRNSFIYVVEDSEATDPKFPLRQSVWSQNFVVSPLDLWAVGCMPSLGRPPGRDLRAATGKIYLPRTTSMPESSSSSLARGSLAARAVRRSLSTLTIWETFATESFGNPVRVAGSGTFPGAFAHFRLLVSGTHTTVAMRLRFNASPCTMTTGLRNPGPEPAGAGKSAHQTSPCEITTRFALERGGRRRKRTDLSHFPTRRRPGSWHR